MKSSFFITIAVACGLSITVAGSQRADRRVAMPDLYMVAIGSARPELVDVVAAEVQTRLGLSVGILDPLEVDSRTFDTRRSQVIGERVIAAIRSRYPSLNDDPSARVVGITALDMYMDAKRAEWTFAFAVRSPDQRVAVVSHARMDPVALGGAPDDELLRTRLRKMVLKNVGIIYYGLRASNDPRSVMFNNVLGLDDLAQMTEEFDPT